MAPTVGECACVPPFTFTQVKEHVRYRLDDIPFTTARKIYHLRCDLCKGGMSLDLNKEFNDDLAKNRQFVTEQDNMYRYHEGVTMDIIPLNGYVKPDNFAYRMFFTQQSKQWHEGRINYLRFMQTADVVKIVPASTHFRIYCSEADVLSVAAKQFVKPDDYFKLTSIEPFNTNSRLSSSSYLPVVGTLD